MRYILVLLGLLVSGTAQAIECRENPDCKAMGYSTESDPNCKDDGYIYCPFDKTYKKCVNMDCEALGFTKDDKTSWCTEVIKCKTNEAYTLCNCLKPRCNIGDVFYADGSCGDVKDYTEEKVAVGVVYYTDCSGAGKVISLKNLTLDSNYVFHPTRPFENTVYLLPWGLHGIDVPTLKNYENSQLLSDLQTRAPELFDGEKDTLNLINVQNESCSYKKGTKEYAQYCVATAALAAHQFYPLGVEASNTIVGAGRWYLPSLGELTQLYGYDYDQITTWNTGQTGETIEKVNATLSTLKDKAKPLSLTLYWASTEKNYDLARELMFGKDTSSQNYGSGYTSEYHKKDPHCAVRASLNFR